MVAGGLSAYSASDVDKLTSGLTRNKRIGIVGGSFLGVEFRVAKMKLFFFSI